jgi:hypothetical protein
MIPMIGVRCSVPMSLHKLELWCLAAHRNQISILSLERPHPQSADITKSQRRVGTR